MKILVTVKRVVDYNVKVRVRADHTGVDLANVKMAMNPFCEIAMEEAVRLKEKGIASEVVVVSVGPSAAQEQLRTALALGADRAVLVETAEELGSLAVAKLLKAVVDKEQPQLVITGKQAIDSDNNQTGQMLAALTGFAQGTFASKLEIAGDQASVMMVFIQPDSSPFGTASRMPQTASLVRENGAWKITQMPYPYWDFNWIQANPTADPARPVTPPTILTLIF